MRNYELVMIVRPDLEEEEVTETREYINGLISSSGGQVVTVDLWGKRRLAYPIADQLEGYYLLIQCELDPPDLPELERVMRLDNRIIRYLLVRADE